MNFKIKCVLENEQLFLPWKMLVVWPILMNRLLLLRVRVVSFATTFSRVMLLNTRITRGVHRNLSGIFKIKCYWHIYRTWLKFYLKLLETKLTRQGLTTLHASFMKGRCNKCELSIMQYLNTNKICLFPYTNILVVDKSNN